MITSFSYVDVFSIGSPTLNQLSVKVPFGLHCIYCEQVNLTHHMSLIIVRKFEKHSFRPHCGGWLLTSQYQWGSPVDFWQTLSYNAAGQSQKAVSVYFTSWQILPFDLVEQIMTPNQGFQSHIFTRRVLFSMWYQTTHGHCYKYIVHRMCSFIPYKAYMYLINRGDQRGFFNWKSSQVS